MNDGLCDDMNNNDACNFDGGDCCGVNIAKHFCVKCECKCKSLTNMNDSLFAIVTLPKYFSPQKLDFTCSTDKDCHQGYCEDKKCICLDGFAYKEDCSFGGCKLMLTIDL